jgi:uncharacterized protein (TIGR00251 family)
MYDSTRLELRVVPGAARSGVVGRHGHSWKVRVAAPPADGRANDAVVRLLAETLALRPRDVAIVAGRSGRTKVVTLRGITPSELERRLETAAAAGGVT